MNRLWVGLILGAVLVAMLACSKPPLAASDKAPAAASSLQQEILRPSTSPYGVNDWDWTDQAMMAMKEAGITWMRIMVDWAAIEATQGVQVWSTGANRGIDFYISQARKYGMQVSASVHNAPDWARQPGLALPRSEAFAIFVTSFLQRYPGQIAAVEVLNEENTGAWPNTRNRDAMAYAPILQAAYEAVKMTSPDTLVATSGMWSSPEGYLEDLYSLGAKGYFDVVNLHYYPGTRAPANSFTWYISHQHEVMAKYGDGGKPIWLTEVGWTINDEMQSGSVIVSPEQQSDYLNYVLTTSMESGFVERVFWYDLRNDDGMALMHATDQYAWHTPQPKLKSGITSKAPALRVDGAWSTHWPTEGVLVVDGEQIAYASLMDESGDTTAAGLTRGANGTTETDHFSGAAVFNLDLTAGFKRRAYYTYKDFIRAHPIWEASGVAPLPDLTPPSSLGITITSPGFEQGMTGWGGQIEVDSSQSQTGSASARVENATGTRQRAWTSRLSVEPGASYFLKAWVKIDPSGSGRMSAMVTVDLEDSARHFLDGVPHNYYIYDTGGVWREIHYPFKTPENATKMVVFLATDKGTGMAWFDDISVEPYDVTLR